MFEPFTSGFRLLPPGQAPTEAWRDPRLVPVAGYADLSSRFAGCTFENGLYRLHDAETGPQGMSWIRDAFPEFATRACPFGYDWLGRQFAVDSGRVEAGDPLVLLLEPGSGEALEVPFSFQSFHETLTDYREPALAQEFFDSWAQANPALVPLQRSQCAGYRIPLFLGGSDTVGNLDVIDLDVYWSLCGQLRQGSRTLPPGTSITEIRREG